MVSQYILQNESTTQPHPKEWYKLHHDLPPLKIMADEEDSKPDISKFSMIKSGLFRIFNFPLIGSTVLILLFYWRLRLRRRRVRKETIDGLLGIIKEKDERITHLLHQIARMNELLLATRHGIPITSKAASG